MRNTLSRLALALLVTVPAYAGTETEPVDQAAPSTPTAPAPTRRRVSVPPGATPEQIKAAIAKSLADSGIKADPGAIGKAVDKAEAGPGAASPAGAPAAKPAAFNAPWLDSQALENKDPALAAERKVLENLRQEKALLEAEIALADTRRRAELQPLSEERSKLESDRALRNARFAAKGADVDAEKARIERKLAAINTKLTEALNEKSLRLRALEGEARLLRAESESAIAAPATVTALRRANDEADRVAAAAPVYLDDPVKDGVLYISDRRIPFNGIVSDTLADFVEKRVEFYNNKDSKKPIFVVMDSSPGGSVFAGLRILKAIQGSRAPVIVVVKQYAASMAAITTTMAARSYCYPDTIILHHQMSTGFQGNMTNLRQSQKFTEDLYERTFAPVYTKIGYKDSKSFEADMYKHFTSGDWAAFGDEAAEMKWVTGTVDRIVETGVRELPEENPGPRMPVFVRGSVEKRDENGRVYYELPPLSAKGDAWDLHDPQGVFRAR